MKKLSMECFLSRFGKDVFMPSSNRNITGRGATFRALILLVSRRADATTMVKSCPVCSQSQLENYDCAQQKSAEKNDCTTKKGLQEADKCRNAVTDFLSSHLAQPINFL